MKYTYTGMFKFNPTAGTSIDGFVDHDKELIKKSVLNIIKTHKGSRIYDPEYGTNLHRLIHELNIERIRNIAKNEIQSAVSKYEPRAKIMRIEAYPTGELEQEVVVVMTLYYVEFDTEEIIEMQLDSDKQWIDDEKTEQNALEAVFADSMYNSSLN